MNWRGIEELEPGKLAVLHFRDEALPRCVGYVQAAGICEWPKNAMGQRPDGWAELSSLFADMNASIKHSVSSTF